MTDEPRKPRRVVAARRTLTVGAAAASLVGGLSGAVAAADAPAEAPSHVQLAQAQGGEGEGGRAVPREAEGERAHAEGEGEGAGARSGGEGEGAVAAGGEGGEGEGGGTRVAPGVALTRDIGFMEGHLRAGMALYEAGDLDAARTHMGHPIKEKYEAVADPLEDRGFDRLRGEISALAAAAEEGAPVSDVRPLFEQARATMEEVRETVPARDRILGLVALTRIAADEYRNAVEGGKLADLHEYQDSWGFLQVVETEARQLSDTGKADVAAAARKVLDHLARTDAVYGDVQGRGDFEMDPSRIYGAAARMEIAALGVK